MIYLNINFDEIKKKIKPIGDLRVSQDCRRSRGAHTRTHIH